MIIATKEQAPSQADSESDSELEVSVATGTVRRRLGRMRGTWFGSQPGCMLMTWDVVAVDVTAA